MADVEMPSTTAENLEDAEESEMEFLRRRVKELELLLESEVSRGKLAESALEAKRFSVTNLM